MQPETMQPDALAPELDRKLREAQADRLPSVAAAVVRDGDVFWSGAVGSASYEEPRDATAETQYRVGSITKTFTATAIMQLRDAGALDLDDRLEQHLDGVANGSPTIRRMLGHISGLQREVGDMFVTGQSPTAEQLVASMGESELVLGPAQAHHYSNLAFALLGEVVARRSGTPYRDYVAERILQPLGLARTTWTEQAPAAQGYLVEEYASTVWREQHTDLAGASGAGQLWSTVGDLCRWAGFLATGQDGVLDATTVEEMWFPQVMWDPDTWTLGWGLGLMLYRRHDHVWAGHGGAMGGHLAGFAVDRTTKTGAAALTNSGSRADMEGLALALAAKTVELWPAQIEAWIPESEPPPEVRPLLGRWWSEGTEFVFTWKDGALNGQVVASKAKPAVFERDGDGYRVASGRERGERLRVDGERMIWAGYAFTRAQEPFSPLTD